MIAVLREVVRLGRDGRKAKGRTPIRAFDRRWRPKNPLVSLTDKRWDNAPSAHSAQELSDIVYSYHDDRLIIQAVSAPAKGIKRRGKLSAECLG